MRICVLMGSPRLSGNTAELLKPFMATPVYTWQATPQMKAVMDRMFGLNKFYGRAPRRILNEGQAYALIATCGYDLEYGAGLLDEGIRRWCEHSGLRYLGMYAVRDEDNLASFRTEAAINGARAFAKGILNETYKGLVQF